MNDRISQGLIAICVAGVLTASIAAAFDADAQPIPADAAADAPAELAEAPTVEPTASGVVLALQNSQWLVALGGIFLLATGLIRKVWTPKGRWGKYALSAGVAGAGILGAAWWAGAGWSWSLLGAAAVAMATAAWGYQAARDITEK